MCMKCWKQPAIQVSQADKNVIERADNNRMFIDVWVADVPVSRDLNASMEGDKTMSFGNWFQIRIVVGKKL